MYGGGFGDNFGLIVGDVEALGMDHPRWANITVFYIVQQKGVHFNIKSAEFSECARVAYCPEICHAT